MLIAGLAVTPTSPPPRRSQGNGAHIPYAKWENKTLVQLWFD
jgi:hypothetical protein